MKTKKAIIPISSANGFSWKEATVIITHILASVAGLRDLSGYLPVFPYG